VKARHQQLIAALTLALACSAVLVGGAQADRRPDNRAGIHGIGSQVTDVSDVFTRAVARGASTPVGLTDVFERAVLRHNASGPARPDDRAGLRGVGTPLAAAEPVATTVSGGFRWADAAIGAAVALALVLMLAGLAVARTSHHRGQAILD
jgi:hypothetical protein